MNWADNSSYIRPASCFKLDVYIILFASLILHCKKKYRLFSVSLTYLFKKQWRLLTNLSEGATVLMRTKVTRYMGKLIGSKTIATSCYFSVNLQSNTKCNCYREINCESVYLQISLNMDGYTCFTINYKGDYI